MYLNLHVLNFEIRLLILKPIVFLSSEEYLDFYLKLKNDIKSIQEMSLISHMFFKKIINPFQSANVGNLQIAPNAPLGNHPPMPL